MAKLGRNDPCYCGSGKKYKKCHLLTDEAVPRPSKRRFADPELLSISNRILDALEEVASSVEMQRTYDSYFPQACAYHHAFLLHTVTRASTILAEAGCGTQLFALRRVAFENWLWNMYYARHQEEARLYVASLPFEQREMARRWASLDKSRDFSRQFGEYDKQIALLKREYPALTRFDDSIDASVYCITCHRRRSKQDRKKRLDLMSVARLVFRALLREHREFTTIMRQRYRLDTNLTDKQVADTVAEIQYLLNFKYPSQQLHGAALSLTPNLQASVPGTFGPFSDNFDDPNPLLWGVLAFCIDAIEIVGKVNAIEVGAIVEPLKADYNQVADKLGIE